MLSSLAVVIAVGVLFCGMILVHRGSNALSEAQGHRDLMSAVVEQSPAGVAITDANGTIEYANPAFQKQTGYQLNELLGQNPRVLKSGLMADDIYGQLWKTIAAGEVWIGELCNKRKDGQLYWENATIGPVRFQGSTITHYAKVSEDITLRKEAEDKASSRQSELAHISRIHTLQQMTSELAHEIHQPLCAILSAGQAGVRIGRTNNIEDEGLNEALEIIVDQADRAGEVVGRIRKFSEKNEPHLRVFDLLSILDEAFSLLAMEMKGRHVTCVRDTSGLDVCQVIGEPILVEQVLVNLCRNAAESMVEANSEDRMVIMTIRPNKKMVTISVRDTGKSIVAGQRDKIFTPFFTTRNQGLGIGLPLCRSIIDSHGGKLWLEDGDTEGNTFSFTLPLVLEKENS